MSGFSILKKLKLWGCLKRKISEDLILSAIQIFFNTKMKGLAS